MIIRKIIVGEVKHMALNDGLKDKILKLGSKQKL